MEVQGKKLVVIFWVRDAVVFIESVKLMGKGMGRDEPEDPPREIMFVSFAVLSEPDSLRIESVVEVCGKRRRWERCASAGRVVARVDRVDRVAHDRTRLR